VFVAVNSHEENSVLQRATGIPPYLQLQLDVCSVKDVLVETKRSVEEGMEKLPANVGDYLRERGQASNSPFSLAEFRSYMDLFKLELKTASNSAPPQAAGSALGADSDEMQRLLLSSGFGGKYKKFIWGGQFHVVPKGYEVPQVPCKQLWAIYWFGNDDGKQPIGPLKDCTSSDFPPTVTQKRKKKNGTFIANRGDNELTRTSYQRWAKAKKVCEGLEAFAKKMKILQEAAKVADMTREEGMALFDKLQEPFSRYLGKANLSATFTTIFNDLIKREAQAKNSVVATMIAMATVVPVANSGLQVERSK